MNIAQKLATGAITGSLLVSMFATSAFAGERVRDPHKKGGNVTINKTDCDLTQTNSSYIVTEVESKANTGKNETNNNGGSSKHKRHNGGSSSTDVTTGNADSEVVVVVDGSSNEATNPCCGCNNTPHVTGLIEDSGHSHHGGVTINSSDTDITQSNSSAVVTSVKSSANTGGNHTNDNTGNVSVSTGDASSTVHVTVGGSSNTLN